MNPRKQKIEAIFQAALELDSRDLQAVYLSRECAGDSELRREVEELLGAASAAEAIFNTRVHEPALEQAGSLIGPYRLLEQIGEGGCGVVYMAEQREPVRRRVALKVIKSGMDTKQVIARFEAERQALALMDHPNIAKVLEAGATETGRPYFVMELVKGAKITEYCDHNNSSTGERLDLFLQVCRAVQHAHQKGVIHRDIKPSNILVTLHDGVPVPKVIDFGIAKATQGRLTDLTIFTAYEQFVGTPAYMSPEQAEMSGLDIDTRGDIYSLGVLLYELLTGKTPFDAKELLGLGLEAMRRTIREREPERPSTKLSTMLAGELTITAKRRQTEPPRLLTAVRGDLDWIVMKCLEKDRTRRYETANGLAADLTRHLNNEPVSARPPSTSYRLQKLVRRNRLAFAAIAVVAGVLVLGVAVSTWQAVRATQAEHEQSRLREAAVTAQAMAKTEAVRAEQGKEAARGSAYAASMLLAQMDWDNNNMAHLRQVLTETRDYHDRGFEWYYWQQQAHLETRTLYGHLAAVKCLAISPDCERILTGSWDHTARVWEAKTGRELFTLKGQTGWIFGLAFSPDGTRIVTGAGNNMVRLWDAATGRELFAFSAHKSAILSVVFSPDGHHILTGSGDKTAKIWEASTGRLLLSLEGHREQITSVAFSPDGQQIVTGSDDDTAKVWEAAAGSNSLTLKGRTGGFNCVAWSPDGRSIAGGSGDNTAQVWDARTGRELLRFEGHLKGVSVAGYNHIGGISSVAFSPDSRWIVTGSYDNTAKVWEARTGRELRTLKGHSANILSVAFSRDSRCIVTGSEDATAKVWETGRPDELLALEGSTNGISAMAFSSDGKLIVTGDIDNKVEVWEASTGRRLSVFTNHTGSIRAVAFSPDDQRIVSGGEDNTAKTWDLSSGQQPLTLRGHNAWVRSVVFSPDGRYIATGSNDKTARLWSASTGQELGAFRGHSGIVSSVAFSPDGNLLVTGSGDKTAIVWELSSRGHLRALSGHKGGITAVTFSPDGQRIVTGSQDKTAKVWEARTGRELTTLRGHEENICSVIFSPNGRRVVTGSWDGTAKVWEAATGKELLRLKGHTALKGWAAFTGEDANIVGLAFSSDGQRIIMGWSDNTIKISTRASEEGVSAWMETDRLGQERVAVLAREQEQDRLVRASDERAVRDWLILAPVTLKDAEKGVEGLQRSQVPLEAELRPRAGDRTLVDGKEFVWSETHLEDDAIDFNLLLGEHKEFSVAYAVSYLIADQTKTNLLMKIGSDDEAKVYLNGKQVYEKLHPGSFVADSEQISGIQLNPGINVLVFKVVNEAVDWLGSIRITDQDGNVVKGIKVTLIPQ